MFSKKEREGYVLIDHRESPGFSCDEMPSAYRAGIPVGPGKMFEGATNTCSHCQRVVVMNPDRLRQRAWCSNCDHYICDQCGVTMKLTGVCNSFERQIEKAFMQAALIGG